MKRKQWLRALCSTDRDRPRIQQPFPVGDWAVATDGRSLLALPGAGDLPAPAAGVPVGPAGRYLANRPKRARLRTTVGDLRAWGAESKGRPVWTPRQEDHGVLAGQPVNRALLPWALKHAPDEPVALYANKPEGSPIYIVAESGWMLLIMPLHSHAAHGAPVFPDSTP